MAHIFVANKGGYRHIESSEADEAGLKWHPVVESSMSKKKRCGYPHLMTEILNRNLNNRYFSSLPRKISRECYASAIIDRRLLMSISSSCKITSQVKDEIKSVLKSD